MRARLVLSDARPTPSPGLHKHWHVGGGRHSDLAEAAGGLALDGVRAEGGAVGVVDTERAEHALAPGDRGHGAAGPGRVLVRCGLGEVVAVVPGRAGVALGIGRVSDGHGGPLRGEGELIEVKDVRELRRHVQRAVVSGVGSCSARQGPRDPPVCGWRAQETERGSGLGTCQRHRGRRPSARITGCKLAERGRAIKASRDPRIRTMLAG